MGFVNDFSLRAVVTKSFKQRNGMINCISETLLWLLHGDQRWERGKRSKERRLGYGRSPREKQGWTGTALSLHQTVGSTAHLDNVGSFNPGVMVAS